ncbi:IclR family transcriptional regulator [Niallia endozanthoxylica]|uniref:Helix-turn-helix domain-containing protein n=1 Tax=Niallia endozanthoxylica TaxID=2036016 RepID=A0A5J5HL91_9BACI|nr:IclR family transcriptional regulator C-terminal domain-containing protein [Niallia endozanthoxylica]KAA9021111.1 helix-turn-helix domain-containing protein [Niallia endozanthoxylica]
MASNEVSTLKKGLLVLDLVKQCQGITLREVMEHLNLSKSTAFRLLTTLEEMNYIYKIQTQYFMNYKMFCPSLEQRSEKDWASLHSIYQIAQHLQMSTYIGKVDGTDLVMTQVLHAPFKKSADEEIGNRSKLHQSALGKVILAHLDEERFMPIISRMSLEPATENTFQDSQLFHYHLKVIRQNGYAFDDEERIVGIRCVAVPVFRHHKVIAALAIAAPAEQISRSNIKYIAQKLHTGSKDITKEIEALETIY